MMKSSTVVIGGDFNINQRLMPKTRKTHAIENLIMIKEFENDKGKEESHLLDIPLDESLDGIKIDQFITPSPSVGNSL